MNRFRLLAIGTTLLFALATTAQQATTSASTKNPSAGAHAGVPTAAGQLTFLTAKLDLTGDQQEKIKPILQELHDTTVKLVQDQSISRDERLSKVRDSRYAADNQMRTLLNRSEERRVGKEW